MKISDSNDALAAQFYSQVSESIKGVFDLSSRIDERVKMLIERQGEWEDRVSRLIDMQQALINRVTILESIDISSLKSEIYELNKKIAILQAYEPDRKRNLEEIQEKMQELELKAEGLTYRAGTHERGWNRMIDLAFKLVIMLAGGYLLWKLNIPTPP